MTNEESNLVIDAVGSQRVGAKLNAWLLAGLVEALGEEEAFKTFQTQFPTVSRALLERTLGAGRNLEKMTDEHFIELSLELLHAVEAKGRQ